MLMTSQLTLTVNGQPYSVEVAPDTPLLYVLRNDLGLNGPQYGCAHICASCAPSGVLPNYSPQKEFERDGGRTIPKQ